MLLTLYFDDDFRSYTFSDVLNPGLKGGGPSEDQLFNLVDQARKGDWSCAGEFADTMYWTLREAAFGCYQQDEGPRPITYEEYFYTKLNIFFDILLYEKTWYSPEHETGPKGRWEGRSLRRCERPEVDSEELERTVIPEDNERVNWAELVRIVSEERHDRLARLRGWLKRQAERRKARGLKPSGWGKNRERDTIILNCLRRGMERQEICVELDRRTIPTLASLQTRKFFKWIDAWANPEARKAIQRLFSKLAARLKPCQALAVSK